MDHQDVKRTRLQADLKETGRVEAFSDGVFAIAITLLVLDLRLPEGPPASSEQDLIAALLSLGSQYMAFAISFAFIGIMWINHHRLFTHITRSDSTLLVLNLLLLMGTVLLPFPTEVLAANLGHPGDRVAAVVYNGLFVFIAVFFNLLWRYASHRNRLLGSGADLVSARGITRQYWLGPVGYVVAFLLAFFSAQLSLLVDVLLALFFVVPGLNWRGRESAINS